MSDESPQMAFIVPPRRGRPRASVQKSALTTWVPQTYHDRLAQLALKHDVSVSALVCRVLEQALSKTTP